MLSLQSQAIVLATLLALLLAPAGLLANEQTKEEIDYLLERVADSGYTFIRNGTDHDSVEAAKHMRRKYEHFEDEITTAEEFVEKSATRSLITKRVYEVRFPDGRKQATAAWLLGELAVFRERIETAGDEST